ncbi:MAG: hypothetical protein ACYTE3_00915, partial [Planctomycetota bacterium]
MAEALVNFIGRSFSLSWLTGPIFGKELRVSSRRRRNYVLRFAYLAFLTAFMALVWVQMATRGGSALYRLSRMAEAGKAIIATTVWFQFIATQVVAVIMLSTSISDEIYNRTLGLLMTTPVNSFQIVMGKLFSKLLQLILLLTISLPLLAVVRVLFFSIFTRKAYVVILLTCLTAGALFLLIPLLGFMAWHTLDLRSSISLRTMYAVLLLPNPYCNLYFNTMLMVEPRALGGIPSFSGYLHCGIMLAASIALLFVCVVRVRKVALRQATGQLASFRKRRARRKPASTTVDREISTGRTRRVMGPPIVWKELRLPFLGRRKVTSIAVITLCLLILGFTYLLCFAENILDEDDIHQFYAVVFLV